MFFKNIIGQEKAKSHLPQNTGMGQKYYMTPHYPQVGGGVYAGVSWRFIN